MQVLQQKSNKAVRTKTIMQNAYTSVIEQQTKYTGEVGIVVIVILQCMMQLLYCCHVTMLGI